MQEEDKKLARELLIQSKVYRVFAAIFAVGGLAAFVAVYTQHYQADFMKALHDPFIIVLIIFPFIPAMLLSMKARKAEKQLTKMIGEKGVKAAEDKKA